MLGSTFSFLEAGQPAGRAAARHGCPAPQPADLGPMQRMASVCSAAAASPLLKPAPLAGLGRWPQRCKQTQSADRLGRRDGCRGLAQHRVILFFWPMRASSANQISMGWPPASLVAISSRRAGKFKSGHGGVALGVMVWASRELAATERAHLPPQRLLGDRQAVLVPEPLDQID